MSKVFDLIRARSSVDALAMIAVQHPEAAINAAALREELAAADEQINQLARALREAAEPPSFMGEPVTHPANRAARMAMDPQRRRELGLPTLGVMGKDEMSYEPMNTAPRDGSPVLLKPRSGSGLRHPFVGRFHTGSEDWGFAAPVGFGGISDEWLDGWMALPAAGVGGTDGR